MTPALVSLAWTLVAAPGAVLTGTVSWSSPVAPQPVHVTKDTHVCGASGPVFEREVRYDARGRVRGAVVYLEAATPAAKAADGAAARGATDFVLDQRNCGFAPRLAVARVGARVRFRNSDAVLHNVHAYDERGETLANFTLPVSGQEVEAFTAKKPGVVRFGCDAGHVWMRGHLLVLRSEVWTLTDEQGRYGFTGLAPGAYKIVAWHPDAGRAEARVVLPGSATLTADLVF